MGQQQDNIGSGTSSATEDITRLLADARRGNGDALDRLFQVVYGELRKIAHTRRMAWRGDETLGTTALVNEAYLKLTRQQDVPWRSRAQFFATASKAMRHILINYAEKRRAAKRGGGAEALPLDENLVASDETADELIALDQALRRLAEMNPRQTRVVECRFFGGLDVVQTAEALEISATTVKRDWALASAWLHEQLAGNAVG